MAKAFFAGPTVSLACTNSTGSVSLGTQAEAVRIYNSGSVPVFIKFGTDSATATTSGIPIAPGTVEVFEARRANYVAGITASGTATLYFTIGEGM